MDLQPILDEFAGAPPDATRRVLTSSDRFVAP
jgi:hypothetical protein